MVHQVTVIRRFSRSVALLYAEVRRLSAPADRAGLPPGRHLCAAVRSASGAWGDRAWRRRFSLRKASRIRRRRGVGTGRRGFDPRSRPGHIPASCERLGGFAKHIAKELDFAYVFCEEKTL